MDDLIKQITEKFGVPADKAQGIVKMVVGFIGDKLPGPIASQVKKLVGDDDGGNGGDDGDDNGGLMDKAKGLFGG